MTRATLAACLLLFLLPANAQGETLAERWHRKVRAFEDENSRLGAEKDIVLFGSSSTEGWRFAGRVRKYLPTIGHRTLNRGISGDGIGFGRRGLAKRLDASVLSARPKFVVIANGRNSIGLRDGVARTTATYERVVRQIQAGLPDVTVVIVSCAPVRGRYRRLKNKINALNTNLKAVAARTGARWVDSFRYMVGRDGLLKPAFTSDGLHFKSNGYAILGRLLEGVVAAVEREQAEREAADTLREEAERLLSSGALELEQAERLRRSVARRRMNPNQCFEHQTVSDFLNSRSASRGLSGLGGIGQ